MNLLLFLRKSGGTIAAPEVAAAVLPDVGPSVLPEYVRSWQRAQAEYSRDT